MSSMEKIIDESVQGSSLSLENKNTNSRKLYIESYGCAMNFSDSEIVASILANEGFNTTKNLEEADLVLVNTCSIREKAELTVFDLDQKWSFDTSNNQSLSSNSPFIGKEFGSMVVAVINGSVVA